MTLRSSTALLLASVLSASLPIAPCHAENAPTSSLAKPEIKALADRVQVAPDGADRWITAPAKGIPALQLFPKPFPTGTITFQSQVGPIQEMQPGETTPASVSKRRYYPSSDPLTHIEIDTSFDDETKQTVFSGFWRPWNGLVGVNYSPFASGPLNKKMAAPSGEFVLLDLKVVENNWLPLRKGSSLTLTFNTRVLMPEQPSYDVEETMHCDVAAAVPAKTVFAKWNGDGFPISCLVDTGESKRKQDYFYFIENGLLWNTGTEHLGMGVPAMTSQLLDAQLDAPKPLKNITESATKKKKS